MLPEVFNILDDLRVFNNWPKESTCAVYMTTNLLCYVKRAVISHICLHAKYTWPSVIHIVNTFTMIFTWTSGMISQHYRLVIIWQEKSTVLHLCEICGTFYIFHKMLEKFWHTMLFWLNSEAPVFRNIVVVICLLYFFLKLVKFKKLRRKHPSRHAWREFTLFPLASR